MLEIEALRFRRPSFELEVDLRLGQGETGVLLGPSGSGKTTLLRLVAGFLRPLSGTITLGGRRIEDLPPEGRGVGMVFQNDALFPAMSVRGNLEYGPRLAGGPKAGRRLYVEGLAASLGMEGLLDRMPRSLSGGERQRVALARALAAKPGFILFDEALSSLETESRRILAREIDLRTRGAGLASLHVTHDVEEALDLADRIFIMEAGRIVETGSPRELYESPRNPLTARLLASGPLLPLSELGSGRARGPAGTFTLTGEAAARQRATAKDGFIWFPASAARHLRRGEEPGGDDHFRAKVTGLSFRGSRLEASALILGCDAALRLDLPPDAHVHVGEILELGIPPGSSRIIGIG